MAQVLSNTPYTHLQAAGGSLRVLLDEPAGDGLRTGLRYLGSVFSPRFEPQVQAFQSYHADSGERRPNYRTARLLGVKISFQAGELFARNFERFFLAAEALQVAADPNAAHAPEVFAAGGAGELHGLSAGRQSAAQRAALQVYNLSTATLLTPNTDYSVVTLHGWSFIQILDGALAGQTLRVATGPEANDPFHFQQLAHTQLAPLTRLTREVSGLLQAPSPLGGNWEYVFARAELRPAGSLAWQPGLDAAAGFVLEIKDNSSADPAHPFGQVRHAGYDDHGAPLV